jgi:hypothetical protein
MRAANKIEAWPGANHEVLRWIAPRLPNWINSDHLTALGFLAMVSDRRDGRRSDFIDHPQHPGALLR